MFKLPLDRVVDEARVMLPLWMFRKFLWELRDRADCELAVLSENERAVKLLVGAPYGRGERHWT